MTGFRNALLGAAGAAGGGGYSVDNSIVMDDGGIQYLTRTPSAAGNLKTFTVSFWFKRGNLGILTYLLKRRTAGFGFIRINADDTLTYYNEAGGVAIQLITTQVFRDPHSWYHLVVVQDTTQATASDRAKMYLNGSEIIAFNTAQYNIAQSGNGTLFDADTLDIGQSSTQFWDGYLSEYCYIDGAALTETSFGEYDTNGVWRPIDVSGLTFGNNGFYLPFSAGSGANLGANSVPASTFTPAAANYTYNATYLTIGSGTINNNGSPGVSGRLNNPFNGDFTFSFTATAIAGSIFGVFDATELSTFSTGTDDGGLDSMTNSWWYDDGGNGTGGGGTVGNGYFMYGNSSQGTGPIAAGSAVTIERTGSTIKITDDSSDAHSFSQTFSGPVYIMVGHRNIASKSMDYDSVSMNGKQAFAVNNSPTQSSDTPTNNSATLTTIDGSGATFSNGNLVVGSNTTNSYKGGTGCIGLAPGSGSWYVEALCTGATGSNKEYVFGAATNDTNKAVAGYFPGSATYSNDDEHGYYSGSGGIVYNGSSSTGSVGIYGDGNTVALRFDMDVTTPTCKFYVNDTLKHTANLTVGKTYYPHFNTQDLNLTFTVNFGATSFTYTLPTDHLAINTTNLYTNAAPAAADASDEIVAVVDNETNIEATLASTRSGFTNYVDILFNRDTGEKRLIRFSHDTSNEHAIGTDDDYQTKSTLSGTDNWGGISLKVDGNAKIRASSVSHTNGGGDTTVNFTDVGTTRYVVWLFPRISNGEVPFYHPDLTSGNLLFLTSNAAQATNDAIHTYTSNSFVIDNDEATATYDYVILPDISGITDLGVYEGNSNPNGPLVLGSVSPVALFLKNIDATSSIPLLDSARDTYNPADKMMLLENDALSENTGNPLDFLSAGFKIRGTSGVYNTATTVFISIGQASFGSSPATAR